MSKAQVQAGLPTVAVRGNLQRLRKAQGLSLRALADRTAYGGHGAGGSTKGMSATGIHEIEQGQRRVDVDDLIILARALDVSPLALLMPRAELADDADDDGVVYLLDPEEPLAATQVWGWLTADRPLQDAAWWEREEEREIDRPEAERRWWGDAVVIENWRRRSRPRFSWRRLEPGSD